MKNNKKIEISIFNNSKRELTKEDSRLFRSMIKLRRKFIKIASDPSVCVRDGLIFYKFPTGSTLWNSFEKEFPCLGFVTKASFHTKQLVEGIPKFYLSSKGSFELLRCGTEGCIACSLRMIFHCTEGEIFLLLPECVICFDFRRYRAFVHYRKMIHLVDTIDDSWKFLGTILYHLNEYKDLLSVYYGVTQGSPSLFDYGESQPGDGQKEDSIMAYVQKCHLGQIEIQTGDAHKTLLGTSKLRKVFWREVKINKEKILKLISIDDAFKKKKGIIINDEHYSYFIKNDKFIEEYKTGELIATEVYRRVFSGTNLLSNYFSVNIFSIGTLMIQTSNYLHPDALLFIPRIFEYSRPKEYDVGRLRVSYVGVNMLEFNEADDDEIPYFMAETKGDSGESFCLRYSTHYDYEYATKVKMNYHSKDYNTVYNYISWIAEILVLEALGELFDVQKAIEAEEHYVEGDDDPHEYSNQFQIRDVLSHYNPLDVIPLSFFESNLPEYYEDIKETCVMLKSVEWIKDIRFKLTDEKKNKKYEKNFEISSLYTKNGCLSDLIILGRDATPLDVGYVCQVSRENNIPVLVWPYQMCDSMPIYIESILRGRNIKKRWSTLRPAIYFKRLTQDCKRTFTSKFLGKDAKIASKMIHGFENMNINKKIKADYGGKVSRLVDKKVKEELFPDLFKFEIGTEDTYNLPVEMKRALLMLDYRQTKITSDTINYKKLMRDPEKIKINLYKKQIIYKLARTWNNSSSFSHKFK